MASTLFATMACPYAHRAMLALALRPLHRVRLQLIPTTNQFKVIDRLGLAPGDRTGMLGMYQDCTVDELQSRKEAFRGINPTGEVPTLLLPSGDVVRESEIVSEYIDAVADRESLRLVPTDPWAAARVRLAMKSFNAMPSAIIALLKNQDPRNDRRLVATLDDAAAKFVSSLDDDSGDGPDARFCIGGRCTLADVHAAPFIYRFSIVLRHYRGYCLTTRHPRLSSVLQAVEALPEWEALLDPVNKAYPPVTAEALVGLYAAYANQGVWAEGPNGPVLAGRGVAAAAGDVGKQASVMVQGIFQSLDQDGVGTVPVSDLIVALQSQQLVLNVLDLIGSPSSAVLGRLATNADGTMSWGEFKVLLKEAKSSAGAIVLPGPRPPQRYDF